MYSLRDFSATPIEENFHFPQDKGVALKSGRVVSLRVPGRDMPSGCPSPARSDGRPRRIAATHGQAGTPTASINAGQTASVRSLPSWSYGFDYRRLFKGQRHLFPGHVYTCGRGLPGATVRARIPSVARKALSGTIGKRPLSCSSSTPDQSQYVVTSVPASMGSRR